MNPQWEYTNTKISREFTKQNYSRHLNDMGSQGWELVTVDTYAKIYWHSSRGLRHSTLAAFRFVSFSMRNTF